MNKKALADFMKVNTGNMTFKEAFEKTGIILNISITDSIHDKNRLLNYISAPNVLIWSAAIASSSLPFVLSPSQIYCKKKNG